MILHGPPKERSPFQQAGGDSCTVLKTWYCVQYVLRN